MKLHQTFWILHAFFRAFSRGGWKISRCFRYTDFTFWRTKYISINETPDILVLIFFNITSCILTVKLCYNFCVPLHQAMKKKIKILFQFNSQGIYFFLSVNSCFVLYEMSSYASFQTWGYSTTQKPLQLLQFHIATAFKHR